jgi:hypothetical protein
VNEIGQARLSRFQVLCVERPAWARPALRKKDHYYFDGSRFWRRPESGRDRPLPTWRAPRYGWLHEPDCDCDLCATRGAEARTHLLAS